MSKATLHNDTQYKASNKITLNHMTYCTYFERNNIHNEGTQQNNKIYST